MCTLLMGRAEVALCLEPRGSQLLQQPEFTGLERLPRQFMRSHTYLAFNKALYAEQRVRLERAWQAIEQIRRSPQWLRLAQQIYLPRQRRHPPLRGRSARTIGGYMAHHQRWHEGTDMRLVAVWLLGWLYALEAGADPQVRQHLHELRTRSALLCASALLHFNPQQQAQDGRALVSSYDSLNLLATRAVQLGQPEPLASQLGDMQRLFKTLERLSRADASQYPALLTQLLQRQHAVAAWAGEQLAREAAARSATQLLQQQSLAMARLLLDYQARGYPFSSPYQGLTASEREALDQALDSGFRALGEVGLGEKLDSARKGYRFVRSQLLASQSRPPSGGVEFYLARSVVDMDELAAAVPEPAAP